MQVSDVTVMQGDKLTIVTKDAVLVCEVKIIRVRNRQGEVADDQEVTIEVRANEAIPVAISSIRTSD